jgi:hypothetical protein
MYQTIKNTYQRFHRSFRSSAVIVIARLNVLLGSIYTVLLTLSPDTLANLHPIFKDPKIATTWIILNGVLTEYGRRRPGSLDPIPPAVAPYQPSDNPCK